MQKVIHISLNGHAYPLDEDGYHVLREYLARAEQALSENPDRAEIIADLEQAIADKCQRYLSAHKTVVTSAEVAAIVAEMGPVDGDGGKAAGQQKGSTGDGSQAAAQGDSATRRLYRIPDGAMIAGVCTGVAAFFRIDVTVVRIGFVIAALITRGAGVLAYIAMMFLVPEATTPEARAAASGAPLNAQAVIDRIKQQSAESRRQWRRQWRQQRRQWQQYGWYAGAVMAYAPPAWTAVLLPVFGLAHAVLFVLACAILISLVNTGAFLGRELPPDVPLWAAALILLLAYHIVVSPMRAFHKWHSIPRPGAEPAWFAFWNAVSWLIAGAILIWAASNNLPEIREFLQELPKLLRDFARAAQEFWSRSGRAPG